MTDEAAVVYAGYPCIWHVAFPVDQLHFYLAIRPCQHNPVRPVGIGGGHRHRAGSARVQFILHGPATYPDQCTPQVATSSAAYLPGQPFYHWNSCPVSFITPVIQDSSRIPKCRYGSRTSHLLKTNKLNCVLIAF